MPGKRVTQQQVKLYMTHRKNGLHQKTASAKAGISERTGRTIEKDKTSTSTRGRHWRTRKDPFEAVWDKDIVPFLREFSEISPLTLLEYLQEQYPGQFPDKLLRTLQRRVKQFKALQGSEREIMFTQHYPPGVQCLSDFTQLKNTTITIAGQELSHLLYHFRLRHSGWSHMKVILGGESYTALAEGMQEAFWRLGGVPQEHKTDSLTAAYKNINSASEQDLTERYHALCAHYNIKPVRNNKGKSHENGAIESPHGHLKRRLEQALLLRGDTNFNTIDEYQNFVDKVVNQHNRRNAQSIDLERPYLQDLPETKTIDFAEVSVRVNQDSLIRICGNAYSVPSRLISEHLRVHVYDDRLECFLGNSHTVTLQRVYGSKSKRSHNIDYRHICKSLQKKPGAFRHWSFRDELLPTQAYHQIWQAAERLMEPQMACKYIVGCLVLAADYDCEQALSDFILMRLNKKTLPSLGELQAQFRPEKQEVPHVQVQQHNLSSYDTLGGGQCTV